MLLLGLVLSASSAFQLPASSRAAAPAAALCRLTLVRAAEEADEEGVAILKDTLFTLEERDDGWNDVRQAIKTAKKDRLKAYNEINDMYIDPAKRWSKVIADEISELRSGDAPSAEVKPPPAAPIFSRPPPPPPPPARAAPAPAAAAPAPAAAPARVASTASKPADSSALKTVGEAAIKSTVNVLDNIIASKQASGKVVPTKQVAAKQAAEKPPPAEMGGVNAALFFGAPLSALVAFAYFALGDAK